MAGHGRDIQTYGCTDGLRYANVVLFFFLLFCMTYKYSFNIQAP